MLKQVLKDYSCNLQRGDIIFTESDSFIIMDISAFTPNGERYALVGLKGEFAGSIYKLFPQQALGIQHGLDIEWLKKNIFLLPALQSGQVYITTKPRPKDLVF